MGLDMWLTKRKKVTPDDELIYWRKANQIRGWFYNNIDGFKDNESVVIPKEKLEELLHVCETVLEYKSEKVSKELLPTTDGFFFGSRDYNEWYYEDVEETASKLRDILKNVDFNKYEVVYDEWY